MYFHVTLYINPAAFGLAGPPAEALTFDTDLSAIDDALDTAYAVGNSYPEEMFCSPDYAGAVKHYRDGGFRSLSIGDFVRLSAGETDRWYVVASLGFDRAEPQRLDPEPTDDFTPNSVSDASGKVTLHWLEPTLMRCDGPAGSQEHRFLNATNAAAVWLAFCCK